MFSTKSKFDRFFFVNCVHRHINYAFNIKILPCYRNEHTFSILVAKITISIQVRHEVQDLGTCESKMKFGRLHFMLYSILKNHIIRRFLPFS